MPELRSGVRRGRAAAIAQKGSEPAKKNVAGRGRGRPRTRLAAKNPVPDKPLIPIPEPKKNEREEGVEAMGDESGGLSANKDKAVGVAPDDDTTPPFPEKVFFKFDTIYW